jgi:hypothetical protein
MIMPAEVEKIRRKLDSFLEQAKRNPLSTDNILLMETCREVEEAIRQEVTPEWVHLADDIYQYMGQEGLEKRVSLHRTYLNMAPNIEERFWSNWHLVDTLAVLRRDREAVEEQSKLYQWASQELTDEHMLQALYDSTQARCWAVEGRIDEWFQLYYKTLERLDISQVSRYSRCLFIRTGAEIAAFSDRLTEALAETERLERINNEDLNWERHVVFWLAAITTRLEVYRKRRDWSNYDQVAAEAVSFVEAKVQELESGGSVNVNDLAWAAHDVGACLMWAGRYEQAKCLLEVAMKCQDSGGTHFFLAACIWASEKDREETLRHLRIAQNTTERNSLNRGMYYQFFLETPEFSDVRDDKGFLEVFR